MAGLKLDNQRGLGPLLDVGIVILVGAVIVVAAGSTVTAPILGVIALWAAYYLFGLEWAGGQTVGKRIAARAGAEAPAREEASAPPPAPEPAAEVAPEPAAEVEEAEAEPVGEMGPELVSPALRELIADLETAKAKPTADAEADEPVAEAEEPAVEQPVEAYDADDDIDEATVEALLEEESPADARHG